jgi:Na+-translocating ferredoxin:NAD+ oxidoreductase RNF subunit RnfB
MLINTVVSSDVFYGLNAVRALSIVALLLAFASSIVTVVSDVRAVNKAQTDPNSDNKACGYVGCALRLIA